jgi:chemotaxis protein CheX
VNTADTLQRKYAIAPAPESVARLAQLASKRLDAVDAIVNIISRDAALKQRLLLAANRGDPDGPIDTVEGAIMRTGMESVLVLAMIDPLSRAVVKTFSTMLKMEMHLADPAPLRVIDTPCVVSSADFTGQADGAVYLCLREGLARAAAGIVVGWDGAELPLDSVCDVVGEFANMVAGNFKSNLCDAGFNCRLSTPSVQHAPAFTAPSAGPGRRQELAFAHGSHALLVILTVRGLE